MANPDVTLLDENKRILSDLEHALIENSILKRKVAELKHKEKTNRSRKSDDMLGGKETSNYYYYKMIINQCPVRQCVFNENMKYVMGSSVFLKQLGYRNDRGIKGRDFKEVFENRMPREWVRRTYQNCQGAINSAERLEYSEKICLLDEVEIFVRMTIIPECDKNGDSMGVLMVMEDMTQLNRLKESVENEVEEKNRFFLSMNHEVRTPLNAITGFSELMMLSELDSLQVDYAQNILEASKRLQKKIADLFDYTALDTNKLELAYCPYDFASFVDNICNMANITATDKNLDFITDIDPDVPAIVFGDDEKIERILFNLIENAVGRTSEGYIKLTVSSELDDDKVKLCFCVTDTGGGIDDNVLEEFFAPYRAVDTVKNAGSGVADLGPSISTKLVKLMQGNITAESKPGEGSTISFCITQKNVSEHPVAIVPEAWGKKVLLVGGGCKLESCGVMLENLQVRYDVCGDEKGFLELLEKESYTHLIYFYDAAHEFVTKNCDLLRGVQIFAVKDLRYASKQPTPPDFNVLFESVTITDIARSINRVWGEAGTESRRHHKIGSFLTKGADILVVDDSKVNIMVAKDILRNYRCNVETAETGVLAIKLTQRQKFDLIFMDHMMTGMDGVDTTKKIRRADNLNANTPIIALTANAVPGIKDFYLENGMNDHMSKPIAIDDLNRMLLTWLPEEKLDMDGSFEVETGSNAASMEPALMSVLAELGIEPETPISALGGNVVSYLAVLKTLVSIIPAKLEYFNRFGKSDNDLTALKVEAHGIKGALANIGASASKKAKEIEFAAAEGKLKFIKTNLPKFCAVLQDIHDRIEPFLSDENEPDGGHESADERAVVMEEQQIKAMLNDVASMLANLEADDAVELINSILENKLNDELEYKLKQLKTAIENFDYDVSQKSIEAILETFEGSSESESE